GIHFHCANQKRHGVQDLTHALMNSCNQAFIQVGARLGKQAFYDYFEAFGLCGATGIDLPAEPKKSEYYTADRMGPVELASCSFGQSSKITPIQMITAVAAVVNGGRRMQPYVVQTVTDADGNVLKQTEPTVVRQVITEQTSAAMRAMMEQVVLEGGGRNAYVAGLRVGGKSGTSQKLDSEDDKARIASFVGVAPIDDPQIAVLLCLDEPPTYTPAGGTLSAPVVAAVLEDTLDYLGVPRQYTATEQQRMQAELPDMAGRTVTSARQTLTEAGFAAKVVGSGDRVISQYPEGGRSLPRGSTVLLYTEEGLELRTVTVPAVTGQTLEETAAAMAAAGLNLQAGGAAGREGTVAMRQSSPAGTSLAMGEVVQVDFYDPAIPED
ncbi:MAG: PASTA domain-containing protein, partial [Oscillospiraceae bacterium]|nr:PASTA domain-containing protein [Oscillospiraceae bacterium]